MRSRWGVRAAALALALGIVVAGQGRDARAGGRSAEPTVGELLQRIEALEKALAEVKRDAAGCEAPPAPGGPVVAVKRAVAPPADANSAAATSATSAGTNSIVAPPSGTGRASAEATSPLPGPAGQSTPVAATLAGAEAAPVAHPLAGYKDGFFLSSTDGDYFLHVGGQLQTDARFFVDDSNAKDVNQFTLRRARIDLRGTLSRRFGFRLLPDFAGSKIVLQDALVNVDVVPWLQIRAGKFMTPYGIERLQSSEHLLFTERSLTNNLIPGRDVGVQVSGELAGGTLAWQLAVVNGVPDGTSGDTDVNDAVDVAARVFAKPFVTQMYSPLRGAGFGVAGTWGREQGTASSPQLPNYQTAGRSTFFSYVTNNPASTAGTAIASGDHYRVSPQATWYEGSFGAMGEYVLSAEELALNGSTAWVNNDAWQVRVSYVLTGEKASYNGVVPDSPFDFGGGHWGAWEIATRWSSLDVDADAFAKGFADPTASARHADAIGAAINWYLNRNVTLNLDYEHTMFRGGATVGDRSDEDVLLTRLQLVF